MGFPRNEKDLFILFIPYFIDQARMRLEGGGASTKLCGYFSLSDN